MSVTVVSFYTDTWTYPAHAERLARECTALGLDFHIRCLPDLGGYLANCRQKPGFILESFRTINRPLLWIDVDGSILAKPDAIDYGVDVMAYPMAAGRDRQWHVGTLFFNATAGAERLLCEWVAALETGRYSDEAALDVVWNSGRWPATVIAPLPKTYFEVLSSGSLSPRPDTVIAHRLSDSPTKRRQHGRTVR